MTGSRLAEVRRFEKHLEQRCCTDEVVFEAGVGRFHAEVPHVWDFNFLRVERDGLDSGSLASLADEMMRPRGCAHRRVVTDDEAIGYGLADGFRSLGWEGNRLAVMVHDGTLREVRREVVELDVTDYRKARETFFRREPWGGDPEVVRQMHRRIDITARAIEMQTFAALVDGKAASVCELYLHDGIAQVEDVATLEEYRGRGLAKAVVSAATDTAIEAGASLVFLVADADDWPRELYTSLGFEEVGVGYAYLLTKV